MNPLSTEENQSDKYEELYSLAKESFQDEVRRYESISDRALKYIPLLVFLYYVAAFFGKWVLDEIRFPISSLDYLTILTIVLALISLATGTFLLLWTMSFEAISSLRINQSHIDFFESYQLPILYKAYTLRFNEERDKNSKITDKKTWYFMWAYRFIILSVVFIFITAIFYAWQSLPDQRTILI